MEILWITPKWPLPSIDGARVASAKLIKNTATAGGNIDLACVTDESADSNSEFKNLLGVRDAFWVKKNSYLSKAKKGLLFPVKGITLLPFMSGSVKRGINSLLEQKRYDVIVLDGLHLGACFLKRGKFDFPSHSKIIYRAHNVEHDLWEQAAINHPNIFIRCLIWWQSRLVKRFEIKLFGSVNGIAPIALEDRDRIMQLDPWCKQLHIPLGLNFSKLFPAAKGSEPVFLFIGRLDWAPNKEGLEWLLTKVWPEVNRRRPEATLLIAGSGNSQWIKRMMPIGGVEFLGFVENKDDVYQRCHYAIAPIFFGSGTRIKVLEAYSMGRSLISTSMGVQGAGLCEEDYVRADTCEEWIETLVNIRPEKSMGHNTQKTIEKLSASFDEKRIGRNFFYWLSTDRQ